MTCMAHKIAESRGLLTAEDVDLIRELARQLPAPAEVVDLGVGGGTSALAVLVEARPGDVFVTSYDIDEQNLHWAGVAMRNEGREDDWAGHLRPSLDGVRDFADGTLDLILLDTSHEYDDTVAELAAWLPKLRDGVGLMWCHDYVGDYVGCRRAIDEAVAAGAAYIVVPPGRGLGVVLGRP